jgi:alpha-N-arabinofuranosidase
MRVTKGAKPSAHEVNPLVLAGFDPAVRLVERPAGLFLEGAAPSELIAGRKRRLVTTELLGKAAISAAAYEAPDGSPISIDVDHLGKPRNASNPTPGPFEGLSEGWGAVRVR